MSTRKGDSWISEWRVIVQDGKTDYKSVTVASNATAEEFIDFYFDDIVRMKWVSLLLEGDINPCMKLRTRWKRNG